MSEIANSALKRQGILKIEWVEDFMPVLTHISRELINKQVFAGKKIAMSIHMEAKTAYLALVLKKAGAEVYATGCNPLSTQDDVAAGLAELGVNVYAIHDADPDTYRKHLLMTLKSKSDLIIDDGGDLLETYCELPKEEKWPLIGGCEETTTGVRRLKALEKTGDLPFPMVDVNDARCKHYYDNKYGTGQSVIDAIMSTTNTLIAGKVVVVAGYGYCGRGIAMRARGMGAKVIITEIDSVKAIEAILDGFQVMTMLEAAPIGDYFITATGCKDVITEQHLYFMKDNAFLANAGHFNVEINLNHLERTSDYVYCRRKNIMGYHRDFDNKTLNVLAEGRLVNLASGDGHPAEIMDMSFSIQALSLMYLVENSGNLYNIIYDVPKKIDEKVAEIKLKSMDVRIDSLNKEQERYYNWE